MEVHIYAFEISEFENVIQPCWIMSVRMYINLPFDVRKYQSMFMPYGQQF